MATKARPYRVFQTGATPTDGPPPGDVHAWQGPRVLGPAPDGFGAPRAQLTAMQVYPPWFIKPPEGQDFLVMADGLTLPAGAGQQVLGPVINLPEQYIGRFAAASIFVNAPTVALDVDFILRINQASVPGWTMRSFPRAATNLSIDFEGRVDLPQSATLDILVVNRNASGPWLVGAQITGWSWPQTVRQA